MRFQISQANGNRDFWYKWYHAMLPANEGLLPSSPRTMIPFSQNKLQMSFMFFQFFPIHFVSRLLLNLSTQPIPSFSPPRPGLLGLLPGLRAERASRARWFRSTKEPSARRATRAAAGAPLKPTLQFPLVFLVQNDWDASYQKQNNWKWIRWIYIYIYNVWCFLEVRI